MLTRLSGGDSWLDFELHTLTDGVPQQEPSPFTSNSSDRCYAGYVRDDKLIVYVREGRT